MALIRFDEVLDENKTIWTPLVQVTKQFYFDVTLCLYFLALLLFMWDLLRISWESHTQFDPN